MTLKDYIHLVESDLYRYTGRISRLKFLTTFFKHVGFKYTFLLRTTAMFRQHKACFPFYVLSYLILKRYTYKFGIIISHDTKIDSGFYIGHFGGIIINPHIIIGKNCNIPPGVILGQANRGSKEGCPVTGDNVFIGPGAKIIGLIRVGNNAAIGANCVVTRDIPDNAVVIGIPGQIISYNGSEGYINRIDY